MATKKKASSKKMTKTEVKAKLKAGIARAKKIHKEHPGKKWTTCVKEAYKK